MTPPEAQGIRQSAEAPDAPSAVSVCQKPTSHPDAPRRLQIIAERADFLKAASARRFAAGSFLLQARDRRDGAPLTRVGFTASKKVGNAVLRNRAKRRMREIAREILARQGRAGWDYVLVARPQATVSRDYKGLLADLTRAVDQVHRDRPPKPAPAPSGTESLP